MGIRKTIGRLRGERGQNLVESTLVLTFILFPLLVGVVDLGRAFFTYIAITNGAREGARYGSFYPWAGDAIRSAVIREAAAGGIVLDGSEVVITPDPPPGSGPDSSGVAQPGQELWVGVQHDFDTMIGRAIGLESFTLRSATRMVVFGADLP